ncbi:hypothetical protein Droror1_Dr00018210 [Drosera rotundifolia]
MAAPSISAPSCAATTTATKTFVDTKRKDDIRHQNILAGCGVTDAVCTSLGPKGMDKMIQTASGEVIITNDGATILNKMEVLQPASKMLVELSKRQNVVAGDGTTTVVVIAGAFLKKLRFRLSKLYSAKGLSLKADALRSRAASVDSDDDLVSLSSRGGGGGLDDEDAEARVSGDFDRPRNGAAGDFEGVDGVIGVQLSTLWAYVWDVMYQKVAQETEIFREENTLLEAKCNAFEKKIVAVIGVESRGVLQFGSSKELSMEGTRRFLLL